MSEPSPPTTDRDAPDAVAAADAQHALIELARESLVERRRARRWKIFFRTLTFLLIGGVILWGALGRHGPDVAADGEGGDGHTALISIEGLIAVGEQANFESVADALDAAFESGGTRGVVLHVNSPGGSPVQSGLIHDAIRERREAHPDIPVHAVLGDVAASGGYYVAAAVENIYANKASIVGSIGVRLDSFGAVEALERLGLERRLLTAGEHKGLLDPFEPIDTVAVAHLQAMLDDVHAQFIEAVKSGRGERIADDPELYSGLVWSGEQALEHGLVDALGDTRSVARDVLGAPRVVDFTERADPLTLLRRELGVALGSALGNLAKTLSGESGSPAMR